jgi:hypothetical protein
LGLPKAEIAIRSAQNVLGIRFVLTVIMPKADWANFVLPSAIKGYEFTARAPECFFLLLRLSHPLYRFSHGITTESVRPIPQRRARGV